MANQQRWQANNRLARLLAGRSAPDDPQISALAQRRSAWVTPEGRANPPASPPHRRPRPRAIGPRGPRPAFESPTPRRSRRPSHFAPLASEEEVDDAFAGGRLENARARAVKRPRRPSLFRPPCAGQCGRRHRCPSSSANPGSARARAGKRPSHFAAPAPENRIGDLYDFFTREISEQARARAGKRHAHFAPPAAGEAVIDIDDLLAHNSSESPRAGAGFVDSDNLRAARERSRQIERQILGLLSDARAKEQPPGRRDVQVHSPMSIPPRFRRQLGRELRRGDITPEILDYHENELVRRDSRGIPGMMGEKSLVEEILQGDAIERLRGRKGTGWRPLRSLGSGGQGGVILWEKIREEGPVCYRE